MFLALISKVSNRNTKAVLFVDNLRVADLPKNSWNGSVLTDMRTLQSVSKKGGGLTTEVKLCTQVASPYLTPNVAFQIPVQSICDDFLSVKHHMVAPFRISFHAIIVEVDDIMYAQNGSEKRHFSIVDHMGSFVRCCALSHNAKSPAISHGMDAVLFFGTGRVFFFSIRSCIVGINCIHKCAEHSCLYASYLYFLSFNLIAYN